MEDLKSCGDSEKRCCWFSGGFWFGLGFVVLGVLLILQSTGVVRLHNWWALFILIPALGSFAAAARNWQTSGRFTRSVSGSITGGLFILTVALLFLFRADWGRYWPVFIIVIGVTTIMNALARSR